MRILVLFDLNEPPPADQNYSYDLNSSSDEWKSEAAVVKALRNLGHEVRPFGICDDLSPLINEIRNHRPRLVFNLAEAFGGDRAHEAHLAATLGMLGVNYTGASAKALEICKDKALAKKIVAYHGVRVPSFELITRQGPQSNFKKISYPAFVKPVGLESSTGISKDSFVENEKECRSRIAFVHNSLNQDALVEEFIDGREIYVGVVGDWDSRNIEVFPPRELFFESIPHGNPKFATFKAKWDDNYRKRWGIRNGFAKDLTEGLIENIFETCRKIYRALQITGYGRIDLRLTPFGEIVFLEANPNPSLAVSDDFAQAALKAGNSYEKLISRILKNAGV